MRSKSNVLLASGGFRCIAHDRRGHGRSSQTWGGNDMDTYADDLAALVEALDLTDAIHVGHSTGGGQITRYIGRYGTERVAKIVLIGAVPPLLVKTPANPNGIPIEVFDQLRAGLQADRAQYFSEFSVPFYGANRPGAKVSQGLQDSFVAQAMQASLPAVYECVKAFSETDFTEDLRKFDVPTSSCTATTIQSCLMGITVRGLLMSAKILNFLNARIPGLGRPNERLTMKNKSLMLVLLFLMPGTLMAQ
jgi:non-heme chloroperoxidase